MKYKFLFIVGVGHSGTTLVARIMGAHSSCYLVPRETRWFLPANRTMDPMAKIVDELSASPGDKEIIVEKTPGHLRFMSDIRTVIGNPKFLMCIRNPRDVAASLGLRLGDIEGAARRVRVGLQATLSELGNHDVHLVRYESLVSDFAREVQLMDTFVGLDFESQQLRYFETDQVWNGVKNPIKTDGVGPMNHRLNRSWQINQPLMDRRNRYLDLLTDSQLAAVERIIGNDILSATGYESVQ